MLWLGPLRSPPVFLMRNTFERRAAALLIHESTVPRVALHIVAIGGLKLGSIIDGPATKAISCILCHL